MSSCENCNLVYAERDKLVALAYHMARKLGYNVGIKEHELKEGEAWDEDWHLVVFIDLPTGQVSWHIHTSEQDWFAEEYILKCYDKSYDGHTTEEKYQRVLAYA